MRGAQIELTAAVRPEIGKSASRRLRRQGMVPAVVYGRGREPVAVAVEEAALRRALPEPSWHSTVIRLRIAGLPDRTGAEEDSEPTVMIKEVQRDLVRRCLLSMDFHRISLRESIHTQVPVVAVGQSPGVKVGGILEHLAHEVVVECLPTDIPDHLEADISQLEIGHSLRVRDLPAPPGVKIVASPDDVVLVVAPPARVEEVAPVVAPEEAAVVEERAEPEVIGEGEEESE